MGGVTHAVGGNVAFLCDRDDWLRRCYVAFGFTADLTKDSEKLLKGLDALGVRNLKYNFFAIPFRVGYPFFIRFGSTSLNIIPSLAVDFQIPYCKFTQTVQGKRVDSQMFGFGCSLGVSADIGMQHRFGAFHLRYGVDLEMPFITVLLASVKMTGAVNMTVKDSSFSSIEDGFAMTVSPYVSVGFEF